MPASSQLRYTCPETGQRERGPGPGTHRSLDPGWSVHSPAAWPGPRSPGRGSSSAHVAQARQESTSSLPIPTQSRAAPSGPEKRPLTCAKAGPQPLAPAPNPEFNPFPAQGRVRAHAFQPAGTQRSGRGRRKTETLTPSLETTAVRSRGRAGRWADKWGGQSRAHVPWCRGAGGSTGPRGIAPAPAARPGPSRSAALGPPRAGRSATITPEGRGRAGGGAGPRRSAAAEQLRPQSLGKRGEQGREGAGGAASAGAAVWTLKGRAALRAGGARACAWYSPSRCSQPASEPPRTWPGPVAPILEDGPWTHSLAPSHLPPGSSSRSLAWEPQLPPR